MSDDTSWIVPGAQVATYNDRPGNPLRLTRTTITKVNKNTFRVDGSDDLFTIRAQRSESASYYGTTVVSIDSDEFHELEARAVKENYRDDVHATFEKWRRDPSDYRATTNLLDAVTNVHRSLS